MILYDLMEYIEDCIDDDSELSGSGIQVIEAFKYAHKCQDSEIQCQMISYAETERFTTFEDDKTFTVPIQFNVYAKQMTIGNELCSAQKASCVIAQKLVNWLNSSTLSDEITDVISTKKVTFTTGVPMNNVGTILYTSVVRAEIYIKNDLDSYTPDPEETEGEDE